MICFEHAAPKDDNLSFLFLDSQMTGNHRYIVKCKNQNPIHIVFLFLFLHTIPEWTEIFQLQMTYKLVDF